jgi:class 3 adenylate cyclase
MIETLIAYAPNTLVALVCMGMSAAFLSADRRSSTSRALAVTLVSMGIGIFLNVSLTRGGTVVPQYAALLAIPDGLSIIFYLEWLLRVRHTQPARNFDTRGGDLMLRLGQAAALIYVLEAFIWPATRVQDFLAAGNVGWSSAQKLGFWMFASPVLFSSLMGMTSTLLLMRRKPDASESIRVTGFILAAPFLIASFVLPVYLGPLSVMIGLMIVLVGAVQYHVLQGRRGQFLSRFLSPQVAEIVNQKGLKGAMQQAHVELSVVCCDLRGFTAYAQAHPSSRVIEVLRDYYNVVGKIVGEYGATIKDYAGDGILILVGAPLAVPDHAKVSLEMAARIRIAGHELTQRWSTSKGKLGIGLGVASGYVTVGIIGSDSRLEYTAVGPAVNLASRLCEDAKDQEVLVAPRTVEITGREDLRRRKAGRIKGFDDLDEVFALRAV